jgi:nitrogenase molybdenum-iron protein NifN
MPVFDRLGAGHQVSVGYRGTRDLIFEVGNLFLASVHEPTPATWMLPEIKAQTLVELKVQ